jgi:hypothetical protein
MVMVMGVGHATAADAGAREEKRAQQQGQTREHGLTEEGYERRSSASSKHLQDVTGGGREGGRERREGFRAWGLGAAAETGGGRGHHVHIVLLVADVEHHTGSRGA